MQSHTINVQFADGLHAVFIVEPGGELVPAPKLEPGYCISGGHYAVQSQDVQHGLLLFRRICLLGSPPAWYRTCATRPEVRHWRFTPTADIPEKVKTAA